MTKIFLIRHGETDWNKKLIFRGRSDVRLNAKGLEQARLLSQSLGIYPIKVIYSSPLSRALETARVISSYFNLSVKKIEELTDLNFGEWEGKSFREVEKNYREIYHKWLKSPHQLRIPGGESLLEVKKRAVEALNQIAKKNVGRNIVIVTHRVVCKVLLCAILDLGNSHFWKIKQDTCALNIIEYNKGEYILSLLNDTCHLRMGEDLLKNAVDF